MRLSSSAVTDMRQTSWMGTAIDKDSVRTFASYSPIFHEGDDTGDFYEIVQGVARSYKIFPDGRRQIIAFAYAGDIVGFGHGSAYRFECDVIETTHAKVIPRSSLLLAMRNRPELSEKLLDMAAGAVAGMQDHSILLCRKSAVERIASFLLGMASRQSAPVVGKRLSLPMCRVDIADFLGLTIETVSRSLTKLRSLGVIELPDRGGFVIRDLAKLRLLADSEIGSA